MVGLGMSCKNQDWVWIAKYDTPLTSTGDSTGR